MCAAVAIAAWNTAATTDGRGTARLLTPPVETTLH